MRLLSRLAAVISTLRREQCRDNSPARGNTLPSTREVEVDEDTSQVYHLTDIDTQLAKNNRAVLCRPSPNLSRPVSDERIAPRGCSRIGTTAFFNHPLPALAL
jgi:hypothetical protein